MVKKSASPNVAIPGFDPQSLFGALEKSVSSFQDVTAEGKLTLEAVTQSAKAVAAGAETLRGDLLAYSQLTLERAVAQAQALATAKTPQDVIDLQTTFAKAALDSYLAQFSRGLEITSSLAKDSMAPITERVSALQSQFKFPTA